jgi:hypothetical protein
MSTIEVLLSGIESTLDGIAALPGVPAPARVVVAVSSIIVHGVDGVVRVLSGDDLQRAHSQAQEQAAGQAAHDAAARAGHERDA